MSNSIKRQQGVASIYFAFVVAAIMGVAALAIEGSRYISDKARLGDVMEAAAIAVSESDVLSDNKPFEQAQAQVLLESWVKYLIPDAKVTEFNVVRSKKTYQIQVPLGLPLIRSLHSYQLTGSTVKDSWLSMQNLPSFESQQTIANGANAARVRTDFDPVDVVFVSDFSGSMRGNRIKELKKAIRSVTTTIYDATDALKKKRPHEAIKDSSFGFVPFTSRIVVERNGKYYCGSMLRPPFGSKYEKPMLEQAFSELAQKDRWELDRWFNNNGYSSAQRQVIQEYFVSATKIGTPLDCNRGESGCGSPYRDHINYSRTASDLQLSAQYQLSTPLEIGQSGLLTSSYCRIHKDERSNDKPNYYTINQQLLDSKKSVNEFNAVIDKMEVGGSTSMYQGLLAAPGQFEHATNRNRFVFVLSDGQESNDTFKKLVQNNLCSNIRKTMSVNAKGEPVKFEMFVIGLQFNNKNDGAYRKCFGEHIYEVRDLNKLNDVIMELLSSTASYNVERD
ncbi:pilus assembly protein [Vibrio navarrensis]